MGSEQVVVSAGEPVAWLVEDADGARWSTVAEGVAKTAAEHHRAAVTELRRSVVLPETPPDALLERLVVAIGPGDVTAVREAAVSAYAVVRAWVAGGGEAR